MNADEEPFDDKPTIIGETMKKMLPLLFIPLLLAACTSQQQANNTIYPYQINNELIGQQTGKRVIIATVNRGLPSRNYLQSSEKRIDRKIEEHLRTAGYEIVPRNNFKLAWHASIRTYGQSYDPSSGKMNQKAFAQALFDTAAKLREEHNIDAIVFTDLLEQEIQYSSSMKHYARWHGVTRKPSLQGPGAGVSADFDWSKMSKAASLWVNIYNADLKPLFSSIGGLDTTQAIDMKTSKTRYTRRKQILSSDSFVQEGINLAFHPFVAMEGYPE